MKKFKFLLILFATGTLITSCQLDSLEKEPSSLIFPGDPDHGDDEENECVVYYDENGNPVSSEGCPVNKTTEVDCADYVCNAIPHPMTKCCPD